MAASGESTGLKWVTPIKSGTYTGDGTTSQAITGVGFQPTYLNCIYSAATPGMVWTTTHMVDNNGDGWAISEGGSGSGQKHFGYADRIISLDSDGFTVDDAGSNQHPNASGLTYEYLALA